MKYKKCIPWLIVLVWMVVIFLFSSQNAENSSSTSSLPTEFLARILKPKFDNYNESDKILILNRCQFIVRKSAHFSVYTILGMLTYNAFRISERFSKKVTILFSMLVCLLYAISDEIHQYFVPGRACRVLDVSIDFSGVMFGILIIFVLGLFRRKRK